MAPGFFCRTPDRAGSQDQINKLAEEYQKKKHKHLYESVLDAIVRANRDKFKEAKNMCGALEEVRELFHAEEK